ncbi:hypothetical protein [Maridesulfovibrio sp.]|uniref:hypothetical protein n=1 Tax=Maridesulfovibrio sp. TaxID=2795000 RepID=UPI002A18AC90|nr:hypothetical protein [Maridesulfovibrio sp.]
MKTRLILLAILAILSTAQPLFAQQDCPAVFSERLEKISGIKAVEQSDTGFLAILDSDSRTTSIKIISQIKALRKKDSGKCDFSGTSVCMMDKDFNMIKGGMDSGLKRKDIAGLLYKYVYALNPAEAEENLRGYEKLCELAPANAYYAARREHYGKRVRLIKDRSEFIAACQKMARADKKILDLKINRDFYLFITSTETPLATAEQFLEKVAKTTPRPDKKVCVIAYNSDMDKRESACPAEYSAALAGMEEELLISHVRHLPGYMILKNVNGYAALQKLNPTFKFYAQKHAFYSAKRDGLEKFGNLNTATGSSLFTRTSSRGDTFFATVNPAAIKGRSQSANMQLYKTLADYFQHCGSPLSKCVLKDPAGNTLGTIHCGKNGCSFR